MKNFIKKLRCKLFHKHYWVYNRNPWGQRFYHCSKCDQAFIIKSKK